jgi:hypothetical protein
MCISTTPRNPSSIGRRPAVDAAHLLSQVNVKQELADPVSAEQPVNLTKKRNRHITVVHNYHDHSHDNRADYQEEHPARGGVTTPFPLKLHDMLVATAAEGMDDIVSWQPHGRCFLVHKPKEFINLLLRFFKLSKLASFQRQLNLYGFHRLTRGRDRGGYYHELFLRERGFLAHSIQRIKVKGTGVRARSNPDQEPEFWGMPWMNQENEEGVSQPPAMSSPTSTMMMPLQQPSSMLYNKLDDDIILAFGNKTFHFLDPSQNQEQQQQQQAMMIMSQQQQQSNEIDQLLNGEAESFFQDFDFPENLGAEIEDDIVFGNLLEQLIA